MNVSKKRTTVMIRKKISVIEIKEAPRLEGPVVIQQGIRDKTSAENWGTKNGFTTVYFMPKKQRVYAARMLTRVDQMAQRIEQASADLVATAEAAL